MFETVQIVTICLHLRTKSKSRKKDAEFIRAIILASYAKELLTRSVLLKFCSGKQQGKKDMNAGLVKLIPSVNPVERAAMRVAMRRKLLRKYQKVESLLI